MSLCSIESKAALLTASLKAMHPLHFKQRETDHTSLSSHQEILLSKDTLTEKDILDFPMFAITSCESSFPQRPLNQRILEAIITPPNRPTTFVFNGSINKKKTRYSLKQALEKQKRSEEAAQNYSITRNPRFLYNRNYTLKEGVKQWRIFFSDSKRQEFTIDNTALEHQRLSVPIRAISAFIRKQNEKTSIRRIQS